MAADRSATPELGSFAEVLVFAMDKELAAVGRYVALAQRVTDPTVIAALEALADEERTHHAKLSEIAGGDLTAFDSESFNAAWVSETAPATEPDCDATVAQVLLYAIDAEHLSFQLYMGLANATSDPLLATLFRALATQEQGHRTRLDRLYRRVVFSDA